MKTFLHTRAARVFDSPGGWCRPVRLRLPALLLLLGGLAACGGTASTGGTGGESPPDPPPVTAPATSLDCSGVERSGWCWQFPLPGAVALSDAHFVDGRQGWAVGSGGSVLHTVDGGLSWERQLTDVDDQLSLVRFADAATGWAFGIRGTSLLTVDGGRHWQRGPDLGSGASKAWVRGDGRVVVQGAGKAGFVMQPGDAAWTALPLQLQTVSFAADGRWTLHGAQQTADGSLPWGRLDADGRSLLRVAGIDPGLVVQDMGTARGGTLWAHVARPARNTSTGGSTLIDHQVLGSGDGGLSWTPLATLPDGLGYLPFEWGQGGQGAAVFSSEQVIARTSDGGRNWSRLPPGSDVGNRDWILADVGAGAYSASTDFGASWFPLPLDRLRPRVMPADDRGALMIVTQQGRIHRSVDGARSFVQTPFDPDSDDVVAGLWLFGASRGLAVTQAGRVLDTRDGGAHWVPRPAGLGAPFDASSVHFTSAGTGWALSPPPVRGGSPSLLRSTDDGATWTLVPLTLPPEAVGGDIRALRFLDARVAWMDVTRTDPSLYPFMYCRNLFVRCGPTASSLYVSEDGGLTWSRRAHHVMSEALHPVRMVTAELGFKMLNDGRLLRSTNGGRDWTAVAERVVTSEHENPLLHFVDARHGWLALTDRIHRTDDGGLSWQKVGLPAHQRRGAVRLLAEPLRKAPRALHFVDERSGYAVGAEQMVFRTDDGGRSWVPQPTATGIDLHAVFMLDAQRAWIGGSRGAILATTTGGR